jgi:PAS domain S-box-containing protein
MRETLRARLIACGLAVLAPVVLVLVCRRLLPEPVLGDRVVYKAFYLAVLLAAYLGGFWPGVLATVVSALGATYFLIEPLDSFEVHKPEDAVALTLFVLIGTVISGLMEALHLSHRRLAADKRRYAVTLSSIGDAVIATDTQARVTFLNPAAEALTGWTLADAIRRPLAEVFHIINEQTRRPAEDPAAIVLRTGTVVGLANHTALLSRDGRETPIDDCGAPIIDDRGRIIGVVLVFRDVSQRRQAEAAEVLRQSERRWRSLTEALPQLVWSATPDGTCDYFSTQWTEHTGVTEAELLGWRWLQTLHPEDREPTRTFWLESVADRHPYDVEYRVRRRDGEYRWFKTRGVPIRDSEGKIVQWFGTCTDITDLRQTEEALRASEQRFRTFVDHAADAFFLHEDGEARVLDVNRRACESLGYTRDELLGMTPADFDPDLTPALVEDRVRQLLAGQTIAFEARHRRKDGTIFPVEVRGKAFREGGRGFLVTTARDVTERKRVEEALRESERRFRTLTEALPHIVWTAEPDGAVDYVNARITEYTGLTPEQTLGWGWESAIHPEELPRFLELWTRSIRTGEHYENEFRLCRAHGAHHWHLSRALPLRDDSGRITKWVGFAIDIDDQKRAQEALRQAKEAAEAANRAKDEFLANVSHEIRTPMNAILGMTDLALNTELTEDQRQCLRTVKSAADNLLGIINDLLDFSKIEAGRLELDPADFSLRSAVGDTLRALAMRAHRKGLELICHIQPDVPDALIGDAGRLRQVLLNLIGNAIKFTEHGEVVVSVAATGPVAGCGEPPSGPLVATQVELLFNVRDTGIGIPPHKQQTIFRAFEQEDSSTTRKYGGTGLGLSISSRLVELMGGKICVVSAPGQGSTFTFTARFGCGPQQVEPTLVRSPVEGDLRVLVVDDNATNRHILEDWLRGWQMEPRAVADGPAALEALHQAVRLGEPYPLVLLDARMPEMDGLTLARQIREQPDLAGTRLVLLTSGDHPGDWERSQKLRMDAHLLKPVQKEDLLDTIGRVLQKDEGGRMKDEQEQPRASDSSFILPPSSF